MKEKMGGITVPNFMTVTAPVLCGTDAGKDPEISRKEPRIQNRPTQISLAKLVTKEQKQFSGGKVTFSTNGAGATGHP